MRSRLGFKLHDWAASNFSSVQYPRPRRVFAVERESGFDRFFRLWMRSLKVIVLSIAALVCCVFLFCVVSMVAAAI
ncbi:hypothetical protein CBA19CS22_37765 [Caballeronia novacaledonica]|uniref:Uncharacterized protein n=1 Tax=Caballeronia novacaledonica TaxID=1544861 RepID=A0ACB5R620_9BURK|nr:hypothetical protein CBA19CS22_37765 [Caballeronia novacaledonica]